LQVGETLSGLPAGRSNILQGGQTLWRVPHEAGFCEDGRHCGFCLPDIPTLNKKGRLFSFYPQNFAGSENVRFTICRESDILWRGQTLRRN
jgi:hypothetical protein